MDEIAEVIAGKRQWCVIEGDCRPVLRELPDGCFDSIVTDPVWPNASVPLAGSDDPYGLLRDVAAECRRLADRFVVQLGCDSDPRILSAIGHSWPFFRVCWLEYVRPHYKGRLLYTSDVAYVFGEPPPSYEGARVMPGRCIHTESGHSKYGHPCPRQLPHVSWLVRWFGGPRVCDPFCGSGTTGEAALSHGSSFVGIEIDPKYAAIARNRLAQTSPYLFVDNAKTPAKQGENEHFQPRPA